jgi:asparagine synthase (glutamine-hydrolysing)
VVLTGEGSDENLAGYPWYRATIINLGLGRLYEALTPRLLRDGIRRLIDGRALPRAARAKLRRTFLALPAELDAILYDNFGVFSRSRQATLLSPSMAGQLAGVDPFGSIHRHLAASDAPTLLGRLLYADIKTYLHELLMKQDQMSMAASIESRVPFLDHTLMEFIATMPDRMKLRGLTTKYVLRRAMEQKLPPEIISRRKMGFPTPMRDWLRGPFTGLLDEYVLGERATTRGLFRPVVLRQLVAEHRGGAVNHGERLWSLINLELWHRIFIDGEGRDLTLPVATARHTAAVA